MGILRHLLTFVAGWMVTKGITDAATANIIIGGIIAAVGVFWSWHSKHLAQTKLETTAATAAITGKVPEAAQPKPTTP